jgi:hypothetical protein
MSWSHIFNDDLPDEGNLAILYGVNTIPRTVLLGRDGKIAAVDMRGPELEEQVKRALAVR